MHTFDRCSWQVRASPKPAAGLTHLLPENTHSIIHHLQSLSIRRYKLIHVSADTFPQHNNLVEVDMKHIQALQ